MPWKETCGVDERVLFVSARAQQEEGMAALCRAYGISRPTGYKWLRRYEAEGASGLVERSRAPHSHPQAVSAAMEERVLAARRAHPTWGARKLRVLLARQDERGLLPAASTIGELLRRAGLVVPRRRRTRTPAWTAPLAHAIAPNTVWTADFKGQFRVGDGQLCYPLTIADGCTRYLLRAQVLRSVEGTPVRALFDAAFREYGLPLALRTDNGPPFASTGVAGLSSLSIWWVKLGITPERIEPGHPEQNGRHERMHRTLKHETAKAPFGPAASLRAQQAVFDQFRVSFNNHRPHEALDQQTPASLYRPSSRAYTGRVPELDYDAVDAVRRVRHNGEVKWRGRLVYVGSVLAGEPIGITALDERFACLTFGPITIGLLDNHTGRVLSRPDPHRPVNNVVGPKC